MLKNLSIIFKMNSNIADKIPSVNNPIPVENLSLEKIEIGSSCDVHVEGHSEVEACDYDNVITLASEGESAFIYKDVHDNVYLRILSNNITPMIESASISDDCELYPIQCSEAVWSTITDLTNWHTIFLSSSSEYVLGVSDLEVIHVYVNGMYLAGLNDKLDVAINY